MYGSRTDKARFTGPERRERAEQRSWDKPERDLLYRTAQEDIDEQIAMLDDDEPAMLAEPPINMDRLHAEALKMHEKWYSDLIDREYALIELEDYRAREAQYDHAYGGYSDDPDDGDHSGSWLPFMRIEELRETFGQNWLGNGFHIVKGNAK